MKNSNWPIARKSLPNTQQREIERAARKSHEPKVYDFTVAQASEPGLPAPTKQTNDVSSRLRGPGFRRLKRPPNSSDELSEALTSETEHADAARLQEAKDILTDYIALMKESQQTRVNCPQSIGC